jgi:glycosyltransferase involved in cell wall biosynthesis
MLSNRDIICIAAIEWDANWQSAQEVATRFADRGNRVLYIENTGVRTPRLNEVRRVGRRVARVLQAAPSFGVRMVNPNLYVYSPLVLPPFGRWRSKINERIFLRLTRWAVRDLGMRDPIVISYLPTDTAVGLIRKLSGSKSVVVYYRIDNFSLLTPDAEQLRASERELIGISDVVFANNPKLAEIPRQLGARVHIVPPAVNLAAFPVQEPKTATGEKLREQHGKVPVIGYIGGIGAHVDLELLSAVAERRPLWKFVLVGSEHIPLDGLRSMKNVTLAGQQPHRDLVNHMREFDVCLIPYRLNSYTDTVVPTKLNEYLALGKPVVSTALPSMKSLNVANDMLFIADSDPDKFLAAIETALSAPIDDRVISQRREMAAQHSWDSRIDEISKLIENEIRRKHAGGS